MRKIALFIAGACAATAAAGAEVQVAGDVGVGRTDNIARTATGEQSETIRSAGLQFSVLEETRRLNADLGGDLSWMDYASDTYSDELIGSASGRVRLSLIREHLDWVLEDRFGQVREDLFSASSPTNRENVNHFTTGPDMRLGLGSTTNLLLGARYTLVDYEESQTDTERLSATVAAERLLSSTARASLHLSGERVKPQDSALDVDYDRTAAYLQYAVTGRRTSLTFDVGGNRVSGGGSSDSGLLVRVEVGRQLGAFSRLNFSAGQEFTDSGSEFGLQPGDPVTPDAGTGTVVQTAQPFTSRFVRLGWDITGRLTTISLSGSWTDQDHGNADPLNQQQTSLGLGATRALGRRTEAHARVQYDIYDYDLAGADNDEAVYTLGLSWNLARRIGLTFEGEHSSYGADGLPGVRETRYWVRLRYGELISR